tara:strand:+ start:212 stop:466 length:255 start_codon:yes stop_codon:yes gene_type:complete
LILNSPAVKYNIIRRGKAANFNEKNNDIEIKMKISLFGLKTFMLLNPLIFGNSNLDINKIDETMIKKIRKIVESINPLIPFRSS